MLTQSVNMIEYVPALIEYANATTLQHGSNGGRKGVQHSPCFLWIQHQWP